MKKLVKAAKSGGKKADETKAIISAFPWAIVADGEIDDDLTMKFCREVLPALELAEIPIPATWKGGIVKRMAEALTPAAKARKCPLTRRVQGDGQAPDWSDVSDDRQGFAAFLRNRASISDFGGAFQVAEDLAEEALSGKYSGFWLQWKELKSTIRQQYIDSLDVEASQPPTPSSAPQPEHVCKVCGLPIVWNGSQWEHTNGQVYRHMVQPRDQVTNGRRPVASGKSWQPVEGER